MTKTLFIFLPLIENALPTTVRLCPLLKAVFLNDFQVFFFLLLSYMVAWQLLLYLNNENLAALLMIVFLSSARMLQMLAGHFFRDFVGGFERSSGEDVL